MLLFRILRESDEQRTQALTKWTNRPCTWSQRYHSAPAMTLPWPRDPRPCHSGFGIFCSVERMFTPEVYHNARSSRHGKIHTFSASHQVSAR